MARSLPLLLAAGLSGAFLAPIGHASAAPVESEGSSRPNRAKPQASGDPSTDEPSATASEAVRFSCKSPNGQYTVMYYPKNQDGQGYPWAIPRRMGGGWTPERRCNTIAQRLESYRADGMQELRTGTQNGHDIVCATSREVPRCRIVLTVPPEKNPRVVRDRVFETLLTADRGQTTQGVATFAPTGNRGSDWLEQMGSLLGADTNSAGSADGIDLRPFLAPSDGGTGSQLDALEPSNAASSEPKQLDPAKLR